MASSLQYTGVGAVATIWTTLAAAAALTGFNLVGEHPISYLGTEAGSAGLFTIGLLVSAVLLMAFHRHVRSRYPVGRGFSLVMLAGLAGQVVAAFVPIGGDPGTHRIHTTSALVLGISLPLLMWRFAAGQAPGPWRRLTYGLFFAEAAACAVGVYLSGRMVAPVAEILPATVFHIWVLVVTFSECRTEELLERSLHSRPLSGRGASPSANVSAVPPGRTTSDAELLVKRSVTTGSSSAPASAPAGLLR